MDQRWIIEVVDDGRPAFICEHKRKLYLTRERSEAALYPTELDAQCAKVYVGDGYRLRVIPVGALASV